MNTTMVFVVEATGTPDALKALRFRANTLGSHDEDGSCQKGRKLFYFTDPSAATYTMSWGLTLEGIKSQTVTSYPTLELGQDDEPEIKVETLTKIGG